MGRAASLALGVSFALGSLASASEAAKEIELSVAGPPVEAAETGHAFIYSEPTVPPGLEENSGTVGILAQGWSMLGREDRGFAAGSDEYRAKPCEPLGNAPVGVDAILDRIAERANDTRIVIVNESHEVTLHRQFSARVLERLRPLGFTVFAAETFGNRDGEPDLIEESAAASYPRAKDGYYLREPVFGGLVRSAKRLDYRLAAYEMQFDSERERSNDIDVEIALREQTQAENLAALLENMNPEEKLVVHVGYAHAREIETRRNDGLDTTWMAGRLKRLTGIDPLTIAQTYCRGSAGTVQLSEAPERVRGWFDLHVDHPTHGFRHGRSDWRFADGARPVDIPELYANAQETLIVEAFNEGEPFEAVPVDRVWVEPGEDVKLALKPGRYVIRAVRPVPAPTPSTPTKPE